jgi:CRP-like cAMP-binding protein
LHTGKNLSKWSLHPAFCSSSLRHSKVNHLRESRLATVDNQLIKLISRTERLALLGLCEKVPLLLSEILWEPGDATRYVYFPVEGFISLIAVVNEKPALEVGMVGQEGMLGAHAVLGVVNAPVRAVVQGQGWAWRVATDVFRNQLAASPSLKHVLDRYVSVLMNQLTTSATCLRYHEIGPRLARWLLMSQDRARSDRFRMTQEFLAYMLGVRRVSITTAASLLQREGLIEYSRGNLQVLDRSGLEKAACGCYDIDRQGYIDLLG